VYSKKAQFRFRTDDSDPSKCSISIQKIGITEHTVDTYILRLLRDEHLFLETKPTFCFVFAERWRTSPWPPLMGSFSSTHSRSRRLLKRSVVLVLGQGNSTGNVLKGHLTRDFQLQIFYESVSPRPLSIPLGRFRIFSKIRGDIRE